MKTTLSTNGSHQKNGSTPYADGDGLEIIAAAKTNNTEYGDTPERNDARRASPVFADNKKLSTLPAMMTEGLTLSDFINVAKDKLTEFPLRVARLEFRDESATEARKQKTRALDIAADETQLREPFRAQLLGANLAENKQLDVEVKELHDRQNAARKAIEKGMGELSLVVEHLGDVTSALLDEAVFRHVLLETGAPAFLPKPLAKKKGRLGGVADTAVKWIFPALFALPVGFGIGLNLHLFPVRVLEDPSEYSFALVASYGLGLAIELTKGGVAAYLGNQEPNDCTRTTARTLGDGLAYFSIAALATIESVALYSVYRFYKDADSISLPLFVFVVMGGLLTALYVSFRIKQAAHDRFINREMKKVKDDEAFKTLTENVGTIQRLTGRLDAIDRRREVLEQQREKALAPTLNPRTEAMVGQTELQAVIARQKAEREMDLLVETHEPLEKGSGFLKRRRAKVKMDTSHREQ